MTSGSDGETGSGRGRDADSPGWRRGATVRRWWLWAALGTMILLISSQQTWTTGTWRDPVLGTSVVEATGTDVAGTLTAGALLAGAALLAGLVGARPVRLAAAICLAGGAVLAGVPAVLALSAPHQSLEDLVSTRPGATSLTVRVDGATSTLWPWLALGAVLLVLVGAVLCGLRWLRSGGTSAAGRGEPSGASSGDASSAGTGDTATDRPVGGRTRRERPRDPWDDLTRGADPTVDD